MSVARIFSLLKKVGSRTRNQLYDATVPPKQLTSATSMELSAVVQKLNGLAPPSMAGSWDNVGLLVEPSAPLQVSRILLTNDLTEPVMAEAVEFGADMVYSYHPPIFTGMKRITQSTWKERIVVKCLENRIAVYSPHTAMDALSGGVNDWLLKPFGAHSFI
jgi:putative NIF3 family GTP cyclohydrolase 1 type 2